MFTPMVNWFTASLLKYKLGYLFSPYSLILLSGFSVYPPGKYVSKFTKSGVYISIHKYIYIYIHIYICTYTHIYIYTYIHIYICSYIHIYIYIYTHISRRSFLGNGRVYKFSVNGLLKYKISSLYRGFIILLKIL